MMITFAPKITFATLTSTLTVDSGNPLRVFGILATNASGAVTTFTVTDAADTVIMKIQLNSSFGQSSFLVDTPFIADKGLKVFSSVTTSDQFVTVFHSQLGS